ncbi:sulfurtransferase TusA family protein [Jiangella anatolica]|uniref:sulfurtransferase TusA family protein n=1 Tax=Jiangella anatolica TaxID=2670374 RepID=UPI0018F65001|nr:sulfurtransferase TusA family protein [Jiangella anatolica]
MSEGALVLDCRGQRCPLPIIELAKRIGDVEVGQTVTVLADDPAAASDVPAWCRMRGHEYLGADGDAYAVRRLR